VSLTAIPAISWWSIAYLVVFGSVLTFIAFIYALQNLPAEISSVYAYINPIIAVLLGAAIFGETLNAAIAIGWRYFIWIVLGQLFVAKRTLRVKHQLFSTHLLNFRTDFFLTSYRPAVRSNLPVPSRSFGTGTGGFPLHQGYKDRIGFLYHNSCAFTSGTTK
jgi:hypothetical protein